MVAWPLGHLAVGGWRFFGKANDEVHTEPVINGIYLYLYEVVPFRLLTFVCQSFFCYLPGTNKRWKPGDPELVE
jgi:hypothetical protein